AGKRSPSANHCGTWHLRAGEVSIDYCRLRMTLSRSRTESMCRHKKRSKIMTKESVNEATLQVVESLQEANKAVAESIVAAQQRNVQFVQSFFTGGVDVLKSNAEGTRALLQELEQQARKQQEAFQKLAQELGQ